MHNKQVDYGIASVSRSGQGHHLYKPLELEFRMVHVNLKDQDDFFLTRPFSYQRLSFSMIIIDFPIDLCMRDKKEFAILLSIAVEMAHFMKKSSNL